MEDAPRGGGGGGGGGRDLREAGRQGKKKNLDLLFQKILLLTLLFLSFFL